MRSGLRIPLLVLLVGLGALAHGATASTAKSFSLAATQASQVAVPPASGASIAAYMVTLKPARGFTGTVSVSVVGCPAGVTCPARRVVHISSWKSQRVSLPVRVSPSATPGAYGLTVKAASRKLRRSQSVKLVVGGFSLTASPAVTVPAATSGARQTASYTARLTSQTGFGGVVSVSMSGCPAGVTCPSAASVTVLRGGTVDAPLLLSVSDTALPGTYQLIVSGRSGGLTRALAVSLVIEPATPSDFTLGMSPASRAIVAGGSATYTLTVTSTGLGGVVGLSVDGLPPEATGSLSAPTVDVSESSSESSTLTVTTASTAPPGSYTVTVTGIGGGSGVSRSTSVSLVVSAPVALGITGDAAGALHPGGDAPIDIALSNPHGFAVKITNVTVAVDDATTRDGCSGSDNFVAVQLVGAYPIELPAGATRSLSELGIERHQWPRLRMLDTEFNQDACKGATVNLTYTAVATE